MICPGLVEQPVRRCRKCARWASLPLQAKHQPNTCKASDHPAPIMGVFVARPVSTWVAPA